MDRAVDVMTCWAHASQNTALERWYLPSYDLRSGTIDYASIYQRVMQFERAPCLVGGLRAENCGLQLARAPAVREAKAARMLANAQTSSSHQEAKSATFCMLPRAGRGKQQCSACVWKVLEGRRPEAQRKPLAGKAAQADTTDRDFRSPVLVPFRCCKRRFCGRLCNAPLARFFFAVTGPSLITVHPSSLLGADNRISTCLRTREREGRTGVEVLPPRPVWRSCAASAREPTDLSTDRATEIGSSCLL